MADGQNSHRVMKVKEIPQEGVTFNGVHIKPFLVCNLNVDHAYQRDLNRKRVANIIQNFDPKLLGVGRVNIREDGTAWACDCQHRSIGIRWKINNGTLPPDYKILVELREGLTPQEEADWYENCNNPKTSNPVTGNALFKARAFQGKNNEAKVVAILEKFGYEVSYAGQGRPSKESLDVIELIRSPVQCHEAYKRHGERLFSDAIELFSITFGNTIPFNACHGGIIRGVTKFLANYTNDGKKYNKTKLKSWALLFKDIDFDYASKILQGRTDETRGPVGLANWLENQLENGNKDNQITATTIIKRVAV
jgi:hypothetical protein